MSNAYSMKLHRRLVWRIAAVPLIAAVAMLGLLHASAMAADDEPAATPYRPSVAGGAYMSRPGWLELEFGAQRLGGRSAQRRDSVPYLMKLALSENWGLLLGGDAQVRLPPESGARLSGVGDTTFTLKHRLPWGAEGTAFGVEAGVKLPTAKTGLGSGERDYSLKGIYSVDLDSGLHLDANLGGTRIGGVGAGAGLGRTQAGWAAAVSHPAGEAWSLVADLSGTRQRGVESTAQLLGAASYSVSKRFVIDAGTVFGLNSATPKWAVFTGLTVLLGELF